ncbi:MAG: glycosyltransferase [Minisyncoccota bacterium]
MKIIYILTKSGIGGAQKYVVDLSNNLDKNKFESKIIYGEERTCPLTNFVKRTLNLNKQKAKPVLSVNNNSRLDISEIGEGVAWLSNKTYPWFLFINDWMAVFELIKIFKKEKPDIVHLNSSKAGIIGALAVKFYSVKCQMLNVKCSIPTVIFTAHGWVFNPTNELGWIVRQFYIVLHKIAANFQDKIICVSSYDYNLALEYDICEPEKLVKIHNGIDPDIKFLSKKDSRRYLSEKLLKLVVSPTNHYSIIKYPNSSSAQSLNHSIIKFLNPSWPWIGSIGRLVKEKNYETFIEAAKLVPNAYFFIIGEGSELERLNVRCQMLNVVGRFFIIPPSGDDARYLKAFDVFAMSSVKEGLPYILLEAMVAELPIVITEAGGMPELIKNHENGLMVAQKNPEALARAIGGLIESHAVAKELSQKAKEVVRDRFSLKKMVSETEKVYID